MKFIHFCVGAQELWGIPAGNEISEISGVPWEKWQETGRVHPTETIQYLPPCAPSKMFVVGWNYAEHAHETGDEAPASPQYYPLAASSVIAHLDPVVYPRGLRRVDHEAELVVVIGHKGKNIPENEAERYIAGFSCGNDVSARDFQWDPDDKNIPRAKTVDTFSPVGPYLVTDIDYRDLAIEMKVNGIVRQSSTTGRMVFTVPRLISAVSRYITLFPGDIIFSGTPQGISPVQVGDLMEVTIEGIGTLCNLVIAE
jgi:2-keto-4-pentenoate hydratase/2-oxohepta-3-ene-1,7-dioic acid hydratase in catechol pathway